jgi:hypothetical protein
MANYNDDVVVKTICAATSGGYKSMLEDLDERTNEILKELGRGLISIQDTAISRHEPGDRDTIYIFRRIELRT